MFVCWGNICRSPMAEYIFRKIVSEQGGSYTAASSATSSEETGNPVYPPAAAELARHGIDCRDKRAVKFTTEDYRKYDCIVCMEDIHIRKLKRMIGGDPEGKLCRLLDLTDHPGDIPDPWYTGDFKSAYDRIEEGCEALYGHLAAQS